VLEGAAAAVRAAPSQLVRTATAAVVVAEVTGIRLGPAGEPLGCHARAFGTTVPPEP
jgi:hypothetical protein